MFKVLSLNELLKIIKLMKKNAALYIFALIASCCGYPSMYVLYGFVNKKLVNAVEKSNLSLFYDAFILIFIIIVLACIIDPITYYIRGYSIRKIMNEMRMDIIAHVFKMPISYFEKNHSGQIMSVLSNDLNAIEDAFRDSIRMVVVTVAMAIGSIVSILYLDWRLFFISIILGVLFFITNIFFTAHIRKISDKIQFHLGLLTNLTVEIIGGLRDIKLYRIGDLIFRKFSAENDEVAKKTLERVNVSAQIEGLNFFWSTINFLGILIIGLFMINNGTTDLGTVIAVITLQNNITFMFLNIGAFFNKVQISLSGANRIFNIFEQPVEPERINIDGEMNDSRINLKEVSFSYQNDQPVLNNIGLSVKSGETIALVGQSGSGKSTIIKLLMGLYSPQNGKISIDGIPLKEYTLAELRDKVAYVSQEAFLFEGTIEDNIRYGNINATTEDIINAAKIANAHDFIMNLPEGYHTDVGAMGASLSGGQRQRIVIARAALKNAPILLLDEATAALDTENEILIQQALLTLRQGRAVIIIAHRLSTIHNVDKIYVIDNGEIVEQGRHDELLEKKGEYYRLYTTNNL